jgi:hypothetical protein
MNEKVKNTLFLSIPFLFYLVSSLFMTKYYYESSFERYKFCLKQTEENNLPTNICSHISHASESAYSWAMSSFYPIVIMLLIIIFSFGMRIVAMNKELKEIKEKLNV